MAGKRDYYEILGVAREASTEEIEKAYRKLARQYHPDRNIGDPDAEARFKEVTEARDILCDEQKRERYDAYGHAGLSMGEGFPDAGEAFGDLGDLLINGLFGGAFGRRRRGPQPGRDIQLVLDLTLVEAATGVRKTVTVHRGELCGDCGGKGSKSGRRNQCGRCEGRGEVLIGRRGDFFSVRRTCPSCSGQGTVAADPCGTCHGSGRQSVTRTLEVNVPPGVDTGLRLQVQGEGEAGDPGAPRGDLELVVRIAEHPDFRRQGNDLICAVPITFSQAALGASVEIPTLTSKTTFTVPRGTQSHTEIRISGEGMPSLRTGRKGDLRVIVVVETPTHLTERQEELLREMAEIEHKQVTPARKSFLGRLRGLFGTEGEPEKKA